MVVAEMFTAMSGLGGAIVNYGNAFATDKLFVVIIVLALLGVGADRGGQAPRAKVRSLERIRARQLSQVLLSLLLGNGCSDQFWASADTVVAREVSNSATSGSQPRGGGMSKERWVDRRGFLSAFGLGAAAALVAACSPAAAPAPTQAPVKPAEPAKPTEAAKPPPRPRPRQARQPARGKPGRQPEPKRQPQPGRRHCAERRPGDKAVCIARQIRHPQRNRPARSDFALSPLRPRKRLLQGRRARRRDQRLPTATSPPFALVAKEDDVMWGAFGPSLQAIQSGSKLKNVSSIAPKLDYLLVVQKEIADAKALEDRERRRFAARRGLVSGSQADGRARRCRFRRVNWLSVGGSAARVQALIAKKADAAVLNASFTTLGGEVRLPEGPRRRREGSSKLRLYLEAATE